RSLLETKAMELAAARSAAPCATELQHILDIWESAAAAGDRPKCAELDFDFHRVIWRHSGNRTLLAALEQTIEPIHTVFYLNATRYDDLEEVVQLHRDMKSAMATGLVPVASNAMIDHMTNSLEKARK